MKKLLVSFLLAFVLTGCAGVAPKYDPVQYGHVVVSAQMAREAQLYCNSPSKFSMQSYADILEDRVEILEIYATYRPSQKEFKESLTIIKNNLREFQTAYKSDTVPSAAYCRAKLQIVEHSFLKLLTVMGGLQE